MGLKEPDTVLKTYRKLSSSENPDTLDRNVCEVAKYFAEAVTIVLRNLME